MAIKAGRYVHTLAVALDGMCARVLADHTRTEGGLRVLGLTAR